MGGHGGLNILPQKSWNVYNYENREKVRRDEEAAAKEEQLKREQSRKRDTEYRLDKLKVARGLPSSAQSGPSLASQSKSDHINLFEGLKTFPLLDGVLEGKEDGRTDGSKKKRKLKKEETAPKVVLPEEEKYRLGYGIAGKGVKAPWYLSRPLNDVSDSIGGGSASSGSGGKQDGGKKSGKKTLEELREERLKRERREKDRERALVLEKNRRDGSLPKFKGFSRHGI